MKKNLRFQQILVISNSGISKYFLFHIFLCGGITLCIDSICIILEYTANVNASKLVIFFKLKNGWLIDYTLRGVRHYTLYFEYTCGSCGVAR